MIYYQIMRYFFIPLIILLTALTFLRNNIWQDGYTLWKDTIQKSPRKLRPYVNLATLAIEKNKIEEALFYLKRAIDINPSEPSVLFSYGLLLQQTGKKDMAENYLSVAKALKPGDEKSLILEASQLINNNQFTEAIEKYRNILLINPFQAKALLGIGFAYEKLGKEAEAMDYYKRALENDPDLIEAWLNMGNLLWRWGNKEEAIKAFKIATQKAPYKAEAWNNLGAAYAEMGNKEEAIKAFEKAFQLNPKNDMIIRNIKKIRKLGAAPNF